MSGVRRCIPVFYSSLSESNTVKETRSKCLFQSRKRLFVQGPGKPRKYQAEQGSDDSQEANPRKIFGRQSLNLRYLPLHAAYDLNISVYL